MRRSNLIISKRLLRCARNDCTIKKAGERSATRLCYLVYEQISTLFRFASFLFIGSGFTYQVLSGKPQQPFRASRSLYTRGIHQRVR